MESAILNKKYVCGVLFGVVVFLRGERVNVHKDMCTCIFI